jgi:hypothetical protein
MSHTNGSRAGYAQERRYRRFNLQFPVRLSFPIGGTVREVAATSRDISIGGVLLQAGDPVPLRTRVSLAVDVASPWSGRSVRLLGEGEVVRMEPLGTRAGYVIAVACSQPIIEMEDYLSAAG